MTEAVATINDYAFDSLGFEGLVLENAILNAPSRKIKERSGARLLGIFDASFVDPTISKEARWELTKEMWCQNRPSSVEAASQIKDSPRQTGT